MMNNETNTSVLNHNGGTYKTGGYFTTFTGRKINPLNPDPSQLVIEDIAHALSNIGRFGGHANKFYSVAQHSVHVADIVYELTNDKSKALKGQMHDSPEAYIGDIVRPLKYTEMMEPFRETEQVFDERICHRFNLGGDTMMIPEVVQVDNYLVCVEAINLFSPKPHWALDTLSKLPDFKFEWQGTWDPWYAKGIFMKRFLFYSGIEFSGVDINKVKEDLDGFFPTIKREKQ